MWKNGLNIGDSCLGDMMLIIMIGAFFPLFRGKALDVNETTICSVGNCLPAWLDQYLPYPTLI